MWIIVASLKNPYLVATLVFTLLVVGLLAATSIPVDILPDVQVDAVRVLVFNTGMPAETVEKTMTGTLARYQGYSLATQRVTSRSVNGVSQVTTYYQPGSDYGTNMAQSVAQATTALAHLPPNTLQPACFPFNPTATEPLLIVGVTSPDMGEAKLKDLTVANIRARLGSVPGAQALGTFGGKDRAVMVYVDPRKLEARSLSQLDIVNALQQGNLLLAQGVAKFGPYEFQLDSNALVRPVADLNDFPIHTRAGNAVYLRDIGRAEDSFYIQTSLVRIDGRRTVYTPVFSRGGFSSISIVDGIREVIPDIQDSIKSDYGATVHLHPVMDQTFYVRKSLESLAHEGIVGVGLVSLMILLFLGNGRMTLIACMSMPLAVLGSITGLWLTGNTLNIMSLSGLALAVGPLVDDAVVELENNQRNYNLGKSRIKAALDGCSEVMIPVLVATSTTILVLTPVALMPGINGQLFRPLALAVAFAMISSFLLSRTFVPMLCARFLPDEHKGNTTGQPGPFREEQAADRDETAPPGWFARFHHGLERRLDQLTEGYRRLLEAALRHRLLLLASVFVAFLASLTQLAWIGQEFFPVTDGGQLVLYVRAPSGTNIETTEKRIAEVEDFLREHIAPGDLQLIISELGVDTDYSSAYTQNAATWDTTIRIQLTPEHAESAQAYARKLRRLLREEPRFVDLRFAFNTGGMVQATLDFGEPTPISVRIRGGNDADAYQAARLLRDRIADIAGAADVHIKQRVDAPQRIIEVDRQKAAQVGLSEYDVITQVTAALNSSSYVKRNIWIDRMNGQQYWVAVQYPQDPGMNLSDVLNIVATNTQDDRPVVLSSLVRIREGSTAVEIDHDMFTRVYDILVNTEDRDLGSVVGDIHRAVATLRSEHAIPEELRISVEGEYTNMLTSFKTLGAGLALATVFVYLLLVGLFRSFLGPFIIMFTVPMGLIGVLTMLHLTGTTLNVESGMGIIFLVGIAVSNGVLLVDFANHRRRAGLSVHEAIVSAAATRFRPILMTFLATFLDLTPMALGSVVEDATVPLARAVVGGMMTSTALTLFVVPALYSLLVREQAGPDLDAEVEAELHRPFLPSAETKAV